MHRVSVPGDTGGPVPAARFRRSLSVRMEPTATDRAPAGFAEALLADRTALLYGGAMYSFLGSLLAGGVWMGAMWDLAPRERLLGWGAAFLLATLLRFAIYFAFRPSGLVRVADPARMRWFWIAVTLAATTWGPGTLLVIHDASLLAKIATFVFLVSLSGAALVAYGQVPRLTLLVNVLVLAPIEALLVSEGSAFARWMAFGAFLFSISTIRSVFAYARRIEEGVLRNHRLREANRVAQWHAETDALTGLKNRRAFSSAAQTLMQLAARERHPVSVMVIDLDHFKEINDGYGHPAGDAMLAHVAELLRSSLRRSDICGRFGGDEFAVLLPNTALDAAQAVAEKLRTLAMQTTVPLDGLEVSVSLSIGIACSEASGFEALMARADQAMYQAKRHGNNRIVASQVA